MVCIQTIAIAQNCYLQAIHVMFHFRGIVSQKLQEMTSIIQGLKNVPSHCPRVSNNSFILTRPLEGSGKAGI